MSLRTLMRPYSDQPRPGQQVRVFMKDGTETEANCTLIHVGGDRFIQWYDTKTREAIDVNQIKGWIAAAPSQQEGADKVSDPRCRVCNGYGVVGLNTSLRCIECNGTGKTPTTAAAPMEK